MKTIIGLALLAAALVCAYDKSSQTASEHYSVAGTVENPNSKIELDHKFAESGQIELQNRTGW